MRNLLTAAAAAATLAKREKKLSSHFQAMGGIKFCRQRENTMKSSHFDTG
jgi:hypothetical protein